MGLTETAEEMSIQLEINLRKLPIVQHRGLKQNSEYESEVKRYREQECLGGSIV